MENIPIIIGGETIGSVGLRREGAYMICHGQARWDGDMVRLWLYGSGEPGYLGVLLPEGQGVAKVRKKFSMGDFSKLPSPIEYCAPEKLWAAVPAESPADNDVYWYPAGDGTLTRYDGQRMLRAFPAEGVRLPRGTQFLLRTIDGKQYVIFPG